MLHALAVLNVEDNSIATPVRSLPPPASDTVKLKRCAAPDPAPGTTEFAAGTPPAATDTYLARPTRCSARVGAIHINVPDPVVGPLKESTTVILRETPKAAVILPHSAPAFAAPPATPAF
jgi:hypothetical protein